MQSKTENIQPNSSLRQVRPFSEVGKATVRGVRVFDVTVTTNLNHVNSMIASSKRHEPPTYSPATVMREIFTVGAATALCGRRSLPTISTWLSMSFRLPAMVSSATG